MSSYYDNFMRKYAVVWNENGNVIGWYDARSKNEAINMAKTELAQTTIDGENK